MLTPELKEFMVSGNFDRQFVEGGRLKFDRVGLEIKALRISKKELDVRLTLYKGDLPLAYYDRTMLVNDVLHWGEMDGTFKLTID